MVERGLATTVQALSRPHPNLLKQFVLYAILTSVAFPIVEYELVRDYLYAHMRGAHPSKSASDNVSAGHRQGVESGVVGEAALQAESVEEVLGGIRDALRDIRDALRDAGRRPPP